MSAINFFGSYMDRDGLVESSSSRNPWSEIDYVLAGHGNPYLMQNPFRRLPFRQRDERFQRKKNERENDAPFARRKGKIQGSLEKQM